jgi:hypothetical protein
MPTICAALVIFLGNFWLFGELSEPQYSFDLSSAIRAKADIAH